MPSEILIILGLVLVNGVFAGSEIAIVSLRRTRLKELVEAGSGAAQSIEYLRENPERFLATVQIGITVVGATAGAFGGSAFASHLAPVLAKSGLLAPIAPQLALALVVALISYLSLVLGELVPKSLALRAAERYALLIARPLVGLSFAARPLVWFLTASSNLVLRLFGDRTNFLESQVSPEEIQQIVREAAQAGTVHPQAGEIASRALDFSTLTAAEVMVPRNRVAAIPRGATVEELKRLLLEEGHTRMPVYEDRIDNVVGYISIKDVVALAWESKLFVLADLLRPAFFVPEMKRAVELLHEMRTGRKPLAIVVDERGGMAGLVTIEDLLEELVGEIFSEHDDEPLAMIKKQPDGSAIVNAQAQLRDVNRTLGLALPEDEDFSSVAGLCLSLASRIPATGERLHTADGVEMEILDASPRRVRTVRVIPPKPKAL